MNDSLSFGMLAGEVSEEGRTGVTSCCSLSHRGSPIYFLPGPMRGGSVCRRLASVLSEASFLLSAWGFHKPWEARRSSGAEPGRLDGAGPSGAHIIAQLCLHHTAKVYVQENEALCAWKTSDMTALCCELCAVVQLLVKVPEQILLEPRGSSVY